MRIRRGLSGNMFTGTVFVSVMLALLFSVEWDNLAADADDAADEGECSATVSSAVKRRRTRGIYFCKRYSNENNKQNKQAAPEQMAASISAGLSDSVRSREAGRCRRSP